MPQRPSKQRQSLPIAVKIRIIEHYERTLCTQSELAEWAQREFNLPRLPTQPAISLILKNKDKYKETARGRLDLDRVKRDREVTDSDFEKALVSWILHQEAAKVIVSRDLILQQAATYQHRFPKAKSLSLSQGWLSKLMLRNGLRSRNLHGEASDADVDTLEASRPRLRTLTMEYDVKDIFNLDEAGLFYQLTPNKTIARNGFSGRKKKKDRLTVVFAVNADGSEKREVFIIGKAQRPHCFKRKYANDYGFQYAFNKKAWMTSEIFKNWLKEFDKDMRVQSRKVLLLVDNVSSHVRVDTTNVRLEFLPPNTTSKVQPLDAGIIAAFKRRYRKKHLSNALAKAQLFLNDIYAVDQLQAMRWIKEAWEEVPKSAIENCWRHCDFVYQYDDHIPREQVTEDRELDVELMEHLHQLKLDDAMRMDEILNPEGENEKLHCGISDDDILQTYTTDLEGSTIKEDEDNLLQPEIPIDEAIQQVSKALLVMQQWQHNIAWDMRDIVNGVRRLNIHMCNEKERQEREKLVQTDLRAFFSAT